MRNRIVAALARAFVYIDGLNFYYGALSAADHPEWKWLDLEKFATRILPPDLRLSGLRYFTSQVTVGESPGAPARQSAYLAALRAVGFRDVFEHPLVAPNLRTAADNPAQSSAAPSELARLGRLWIHHGHRNKTQDVYGRFPGEFEKFRFRVSPREKGTDVNLASRMVADAAHDRFDVAVLIANDGDYAGLCRVLLEDFADSEKFGSRKKILLFAPTLSKNRFVVEQLAASVGGMRNVRPIFPGTLDKSQLPDVILGTKIRRPEKWKKLVECGDPPIKAL